MWDWLTYPLPWLEAFADMAPVIEAERALLSATIAHLPHMMDKRNNSKRRRIMDDWRAQAQRRGRRNNRAGIRVLHNPREYAGWFDATYRGREYKPEVEQ